MGSPWHIAHNAMRGRDHLKGKSLDRRVVRRVWTFAQPYRRMILGFLATIVLASLIGIVPPLIFKSLIDLLRGKHPTFSAVNRRPFRAATPSSFLRPQVSGGCFRAGWPDTSEAGPGLLCCFFRRLGYEK